MKRVSVILPTLNERENIIALIRAIEDVLGSDFEVIVIDDDSEDGTFQEVSRYAQGRPAIVTVCRKGKQAIGYRSALEMGIALSTGKILIWMDADFSHPPEIIETMLRPIEGDTRDVVIASRFSAGSRDLTAAAGAPFVLRFQKWLSRGLNGTYNAFVNPRVEDWTSGFVAIKREWLTGISLLGKNHEYFAYLIYGLLERGARIGDVPYVSPARKGGQSKVARGYRSLAIQGVGYLKVCAVIFFRKWTAFFKTPTANHLNVAGKRRCHKGN